MSNADRIEELRSKYEENPRRYFAPLANEYRKAGDLSQAIAICREHLPKQPGHMSGYIVYGQTLFEANNLEEARTVFEQALTLDPENLIALKHLGDIARMNGENSTARRWYARVLDADPRNDDIASQLASLGSPTPVTPVAAVPQAPSWVQPPLEEAVGVFKTFDPSSLLDVPDDVAGIAGASEFWSPAAPEERKAQQHEPLDLDFPETPEPAASAITEADADFEEGILAPEWPDTTELVARIVTPLRSATPVSVPATPETVEAFGRERTDEALAQASTPEPSDELVDAFLPPDVSGTRAEAEIAATAAADTGAADPQAYEEQGSESQPVEHAAFDLVPSEFDAIEPLAFEAVASEDAPSEDAASEAVAFETVASETVESESFAFEDDSDFVGAEQEPMSAVTEEIPTPAFAAFEDEEFSSEAAVAQPFSEPLSVATFEPILEDAETSAPAAASEHFVADAAETLESIASDEHPVVAAGVVEWAEPESVPPSELEDLSFAAELPFEPEASANGVTPTLQAVDSDNTDESDLGDTAEFAVPAHFASGSHEAVHAETETVVEADESREESFAEISSELQSERDATDRAEEVFAESTESEKAQPFVTETMAELLVSQGFHSRAIEVYDELVRRRPHDPVLVSRLAELRALEQSESERAASAVSDTASADHNAAESSVVESSVVGSDFAGTNPTPLYNTPVRTTPLYSTPQFSAPVYNTPARVTPVYNTPQSVTPQSVTPLAVPALSTVPSTLANLSERNAGERLQAFRTARERFAELSRRRVARRTPTHATAVADDVSDGLSSLFGTTAPASTDELAARALADAFGPVQDSGESLFDPAPMQTPAMPLRALTPRVNAAVSSHTAGEARGDRQPSADYSFDKFFPDPAMAGREAPTSPSPSASASVQPVNEDLAQFSAWLKGLNNS